MKSAKVLSTAIEENSAGVKIMTCVAELLRGQSVTAEWVSSFGEASRPVNGDWVIVTPREQSFGGYLAFGFVDVINQIFAEPGIKLIFGRDNEGIIRTKIALTEEEIIIQNPSGVTVELLNGELVLNSGDGTVLEADRTQAAMDDFSTVILEEFKRVAAGTEPNPANPYIPSPSLPVDLEAAKSKSIKIP